MRWRSRPAGLLFFLALPSACANDFDQFDFGGRGGANPDGSKVAVPPLADASAGADVQGPADAPSLTTADADARARWDSPTDVVGDGADASVGAVVDAGDESSIADGMGEAEASFDDISTDAESGSSLDAAVVVDASCDDGGKRCGNRCVDPDDPATGCGAWSCQPCALPNATARCREGSCAVAICAAGFDDCDGLADNGCETALAGDIDNCGACGRTCSGSGVLSKQCAGGVCVSSCALGFANCERPVSGADDGCERSVSEDSANCGSCGNDCGAEGAGLVCGVVRNQCGCSDDLGCREAGTCDTTTGLCSCGDSPCRPGEACRAGEASVACSCNAGSPCASGQTCCRSPLGCRDLLSDPSNCGACGRACPYGLFCTAGDCACTADAQCNAGSPGTCSAGQCVCDGIVCAGGQRCLAGGRCG